jgi:hypothetical protein
MWFYWINVADRLNTVLFTIVIAIGVTEIIMMIVAGLSYSMGKDYGPDDPDLQMAKALIKPIIICGIVLAASMIGVVFIPSKNTLIEMQVARFATYENAEWTVETVKSAVDYIVDAIAKVNGG